MVTVCFQKFLRTFPNSNHVYAESIRYCLTMNDNEMATEEFQSIESRLESTKNYCSGIINNGNQCIWLLFNLIIKYRKDTVWTTTN